MANRNNKELRQLSAGRQVEGQSPEARLEQVEALKALTHQGFEAPWLAIRLNCFAESAGQGGKQKTQRIETTDCPTSPPRFLPFRRSCKKSSLQLLRRVDRPRWQTLNLKARAGEQTLNPKAEAGEQTPSPKIFQKLNRKSVVRCFGEFTGGENMLCLKTKRKSFRKETVANPKP